MLIDDATVKYLPTVKFPDPKHPVIPEVSEEVTQLFHSIAERMDDDFYFRTAGQEAGALT